MSSKSEQNDQRIQSLSLKELKGWNSSAIFSPIEESQSKNDIKPTHEDESVQNLSITQLRAITTEAFLSLEEKSAKTGLPEEVIQKIETNKIKATLEEIIQYCKGLNIRLTDFLPEYL